MPHTSSSFNGSIIEPPRVHTKSLNAILRLRGEARADVLHCTRMKSHDAKLQATHPVADVESIVSGTSSVVSSAAYAQLLHSSLFDLLLFVLIHSLRTI